METKMPDQPENNPVYSHSDPSPVNLTEEEWKNILPGKVYDIARKKGTERPFSSPFEDSKEIGADRARRIADGDGEACDFLCRRSGRQSAICGHE